MRINKRIDASLENQDNQNRLRKRKEASLPPQTKAEAQLILDRIWDISPVLSLCCSISALTGLRYSDASWLRFDDFYDEYGNFRESFKLCQQKTFRMRTGKKKSPMPKAEAYGKSLVTIYTNEEIESVVQEARLLNPKGEYLFSNKRSAKVKNGNRIERPMSVVSADRHHAKVRKELQLPYTLATHSWRKMFALLLLRNKVSIEQIRDSLGHSTIMSTDKYLHSFTTELKSNIQKISLQET